MRRFNKAMSFLLAFLMIVSLLPVGLITVGAADDGIVVIAGSDYQDPSYSDDKSAANVSAILRKIKIDHPQADGFIFCGDLSRSWLSDSTLQASLASLKSTVEYTFGTALNEVFVQGNHDQVTQGTNGLSGSGAHDTDNYGVFVIDEDDYQWASNVDKSRIQTTAANLKTYMDAKVAEGYTKPIFVASHVPLHFTTRTVQNGDGRYAKYIFDVLNEAGAAGLTIFFLYGHDHSNGWDNYLGGAAVYLAAGDSIHIADPDQTPAYGTFTTETLNFQYMNAGFLGYYADYEPETDASNTSSGVDKTLTMTVFTIKSNQVTVERYDADGKHVLKAAGKENVAHEDYGVTITDFTYNDDTVSLASTLEDAATGVKVTTHSGTTVTVTPVTVAADKLSAAHVGNHVAYDIQVNGFETGTVATVSVPLPAGFDAARTRAYYVNGTSLEVLKTTVAGGMVTFTTSHFSTYLIGELADDDIEWVTVPGPFVAEPVTELQNGYKVFIQSYSQPRHYLTDEVNSEDRLVLVTLDADASNAPDAPLWTCVKDSTGVYLMNDAGRYLTVGNESAGVTRTMTALALRYISDGYWEIGQVRKKATYYLNHWNGPALTNTEAGGWTAGASDPGSRWNLYKGSTGAPTYAGVAGSKTFTLNVGQFTTLSALTEHLRNSIVVYTATAADGSDRTATTDYTIDGDMDLTVTGTGAFTVTVNGTAVATLTVNLVEREVARIEAVPMEGSVLRRASTSALTGSMLYVYYADSDEHDVIPVTCGMLSGDFTTSEVGTYEGLTINYGGKTIEGYTLTVTARPTEVDYPEYPNEGAVRVDKTATGIDFNASGIVKIQLSAAGIPVKAGVDVIVMVDTSSSMNYGDNDLNSYPSDETQRRIYMLKSALKNMMASFRTPNEDGTESDIRVAIADFNGYTSISTSDSIGGHMSAASNLPVSVFTGTNQVDAGAFVKASMVTDAEIDAITTHSGTNYDYAFETIYQLGTAITKKNADEGEERELVVIFMSDGAPFQYNYFTSNSSTAEWNKWLTGAWTQEAWDAYTDTSSEHKYFYNGYGNSHRMADAIKGDPDQMYTVIRNDSSLSLNGQTYMTEVPGLGATMYSIGFCIYADQQITQSTTQYVIEHVASVSNGKRLYYNAENSAALNAAFEQIANDIKLAATMARFVDTMGSHFDLRMAPLTYTLADGTVKTLTPTITVTNYDIYKVSQVGTMVNGHRVTAQDVGYRYGDGTTRETVTFNADGTAAYSSVTGSGVNIMHDGVIEASTFWYNSNSTSVRIDTDGDGVDDYDLAPETFYWKIGAISDDEVVLTYYLYLAGSLEGDLPSGAYTTNESAILYYTNWLEHEAQRVTVSPVIAWGDAVVRYAFYLVNDAGEIVVNQYTGQTGSFANRITVVPSTLYQTLYLNNETEAVASVLAADIVPVGYTLFDQNAAYTIRVNSNGGGSWVITGDQPARTTYVSDYGGLPTTEDGSGATHDYTHTTVWFALRFEPKPMPDTVVIDFGLDVDINVMSNDRLLSQCGSVFGIAPLDRLPDAIYTELPPVGFGSSLALTHGSARVEGNKVIYTPADMMMDGSVTFAYTVKFSGDEGNTNNGYYYSTVTVVPATSIYYEDSFVTYEGDWEEVGETETGSQHEDLPGATEGYNYGYDDAYLNGNGYSYGSAHKVTVSQGMTSWPVATFTFTGTGFDLISLTSKDTGSVKIKVYDENDNHRQLYSWVVDTFYGYDQVVEDGFLKTVYQYNKNDGQWHATREQVADQTVAEDEILITALPAEPVSMQKYVMFEVYRQWVLTKDENNDLYQIPILKSGELPYSTYTVTVTPMYSTLIDHNNEDGTNSYDFYLDAIRIYAPAAEDEEVHEYHKQDGEAWPQFIEIRKQLLAQGAFDADPTREGAVFIDGYGVSGNISDYTNFGPNHEVYLMPGQAIAFNLNAPDVQIASVQIAAKSVRSDVAMYVNGRDIPLATATDLYYDITDLVTFTDGVSDTVIIANNSEDGGAILSLTNIKITFAEHPAGPAPMMLFSTASASRMAAERLFASYIAMKTEETVEDTVPETEPETEPETAPETAPETEPPVFVPASVKVSIKKNHVTVGDKILVNITTSGDVAGITVNGVDATLSKTNRKTGEKTWVAGVAAEEAGEMVVSVVASDNAGVQSAAVVSTVTVTAKVNLRNTVVTIVNALADKLANALKGSIGRIRP